MYETRAEAAIATESNEPCFRRASQVITHIAQHLSVVWRPQEAVEHSTFQVPAVVRRDRAAGRLGFSGCR